MIHYGAASRVWRIGMDEVFTVFVWKLWGNIFAQKSVSRRHHIKERRWLERTFIKLSLELTTACIQKNFKWHAMAYVEETISGI